MVQRQPTLSKITQFPVIRRQIIPVGGERDNLPLHEGLNGYILTYISLSRALAEDFLNGFML